MSDDRTESFWGWGWREKFPSAQERENIGEQVRRLLDLDALEAHDPPALEDLELPEPRIAPPESLEVICTTETRVRARHTYGRSYPDLVRGFRGDFEGAPDIVARPRRVDQVRELLEWACDADLAVVPFGGGTSVVRGVETGGIEGYQGVVTVDMRAMDRVLEVDERAGSAWIQAGATGPRVAEQLTSTGLCLRHYPQSYEFSTIGGWIATRSGGHYATVYTHFDDFVESVRMVAPGGEFVTRRLPASGAGPDPEAIVAGSEGTLGIITDAWIRLQDRPVHRSKATLHFEEFDAGVDACRALARSRLHPANCRLLDAREAMLNGVSFDGTSVLLLGFESSSAQTRSSLESALRIAREFGGSLRDDPRHREPGGSTEREGESAQWRSSFFEAPYLQNTMVSLGVLADTFETACTWSAFEELHARLIETATEALEEVCGAGFVSCRFTHVYPDGPAPYYTLLGPAERGSELEQWGAIKSAVSEVLSEMGATITHHHAVGRTHKTWYRRERPDLFGATLRSAREEFDPEGVMNPGVLEPRR